MRGKTSCLSRTVVDARPRGTALSTLNVRIVPVTSLSHSTTKPLFFLGKAWPTHKPTCKPFSAPNTVTIKPFYTNSGTAVPTAMVTRQLLGISPATPLSPSHFCSAHVPSNESTKCMIIKVQLPLNWDDGALFVYTKMRSFMCSVQKQDLPSAYDQIVKVVKTWPRGGWG